MFDFLITRKTLNRMVDSLQAEVRQLNQDLAALSKLYSDIQQSQATTLDMMKNIVASEVDQRVKSIEQARAEKLTGKNPYFEVVTEIDLDNGDKTKFELDWNQAFVDELRKKGYTGNTETELVQKWIRVIADHVEQDAARQNP